MGKNKESSGLSNREYEMEEQFVLRFPDDHAVKLRELLRRHSLKDLLKFKWDDDMRHCQIQFGSVTMIGTLKDLPAVIECQKTLDNLNFYKSADISQMLVCVEGYDNDDLHHRKDGRGKGEYIWPHGLTPPLKNARKARFRKTAPKKFIASQDVENEVKNLIREDELANSVSFEVIDVVEGEKGDEEDQIEGLDEEDDEDAGGDAGMSNHRAEGEDEDDMQSRMTSDAEGNDDDLGLDDDSDDDEEIEGDDGEEETDYGGKPGEAQESEADTYMNDNSEGEDEFDDDDDMMEDIQSEYDQDDDNSTRLDALQKDIDQVEEEIKDLQNNIAEKEAQIATLPNPLLR
eukprot:Ihof_evm3s508 gene=Ihof_evmTU3s508